jgi:hypothetical protein
MPGSLNRQHSWSGTQNNNSPIPIAGSESGAQGA